MQSDQAARWRQNFQKAKTTAAQVQAELQKLDLLTGQDTAQRSERQKMSATIRGKASQLKIELDQLQRGLDSLSSNSAENEVTRKSITQFRDELAQVVAEHQEIQKRLRPSAAPETNGIARPERGAEMQPVSQRQMLERQQQMMREMDAPLAALEGSVNNLQQVSYTIRNEISMQNRLLDNTNQTADRASSRLNRARSLLNRLTTVNQNRCLGLSVVLLFACLVALFIYVLS